MCEILKNEAKQTVLIDFGSLNPYGFDYGGRISLNLANQNPIWQCRFEQKPQVLTALLARVYSIVKLVGIKLAKFHD